MSFAVRCWTHGDRPDSQGATNACRFATHDEASRAGEELYSRWMSLDRYVVEESQDAVNYTIGPDGRPASL